MDVSHPGRGDSGGDPENIHPGGRAHKGDKDQHRDSDVRFTEPGSVFRRFPADPPCQLSYHRGFHMVPILEKPLNFSPSTRAVFMSARMTRNTA